MRKSIFLASLILFFSAASFLLHAQPRIKFNERDHDFGDVVEGTLPSCIFGFKNTGNKELILTKVQASCGCTSPSWSKEPVQPGDSGFIKVVFNTRGYKNKDFVKSVMVYTNAKENKKKVNEALLIRGHVVPKDHIKQYPIKTSTLYHNFGQIVYGKKAKCKISIYNKGDSIISFKEIKQLKGYDIGVKIKPETINPKDSAVISVVFDTKLLKPGAYDDRIKIITNLDTKSTRDITKKGILIKAEVISKETAKQLKKMEKEKEKQKAKEKETMKS